MHFKTRPYASSNAGHCNSGMKKQQNIECYLIGSKQRQGCSFIIACQVQAIPHAYFKLAILLYSAYITQASPQIACSPLGNK